MCVYMCERARALVSVSEGASASELSSNRDHAETRVERVNRCTHKVFVMQGCSSAYTIQPQWIVLVQ